MRTILNNVQDTRHTKQRQAILRTVKLSTQPLTAEDVLGRLQPAFSGLSLATVYRNLDYFAKRGEVYRVEGEDGVKRFAGHSFHSIIFRCQRCGEETQLPNGQLLKYVRQQLWGGQSVFFSRLLAQGLCQKCLKILQRQGVRT